MADVLDHVEKAGLRTPFCFAVGSSHPNPMELVLASFALTMCRWTGETEAVVAVTEMGSDGVDGQRIAVVRIDDEMTVADFLQVVRDVATFEVTDGQLTIDPNLDLVIAYDEIDQWCGEICFITEINDPQAFIDDAAAALEALASERGLLEDVRCISPERRRILDLLVGTDVPVVDINTLFLEQVLRRPQHVAISDGEFELTYEQLSYAADQHARVLQGAGVRPGSKVLVATRPSIGEVVAVLAIVRLGAVYAGFVDDDPEARTRLVLQKLAPVVAVVDAATSAHPTLSNLSRVDIWRPEMDVSTKTSAVFSTTGLDAAHSAAFVSFTSGTTGGPKGVVITQKAVTRLALSPELRINPEDHVMRMAPLTFDTSQFEIWGTLLNGATLEVFPAKVPVIGKIEAFFKEQKISVVWLTAGVFRLIANSRPKAFAGLRWIVTGGEVVPYDCVAHMLDMHPDLVITNGYGPTENTTFTTTYTVRKSSEITGPLPIGRPIAGTSIFVLDRNARLIPPGAIGELYAGGSGIADGYLDDETQTNSRFGYFCRDVDERLYRTGDLVRLDPNGNLLFLGRADRQIKLNSYRIELEEISSTLASHSDVRDAVIIVSKKPDGETCLVAAVVAQHGTEPDPRTLREYLSGLVPSYAVPSLWVVVDEIPVTRNGKIAERTLIEAAKPAAHAGRK